MIAEIIGYAALVVALASFMQNSIVRLRWMGIVASMLFLTQAVMIEKHSLIVANICFILVHSYWIYKYKVVDK